MAEAILKHLHGHHIYIDSVGIRRGELDPFAVEVLDEIGLDLSRHKPKTFDELEDISFDVIITLSPDAQHRAVATTRSMAARGGFWPTFDPSTAPGRSGTPRIGQRWCRPLSTRGSP